MIEGLELFGIGASWGGYESLVLPFDAAKTRSATAWQPEGPTVRLHIGLEDVADLKEDLEAGFRASRRGRPGARRYAVSRGAPTLAGRGASTWVIAQSARGVARRSVAAVARSRLPGPVRFGWIGPGRMAVGALRPILHRYSGNLASIIANSE